MKAEIITIGDEILIGQIVDTNSAYLGKALNTIGIDVYQITSIQDEKQHIIEALTAARNRVDVVLITGGLGPTKDDITKHTLCDFFEDKLVEDVTVLQHIESLFEKYISSPISEVHKKQALIPSRAIALHNEVGTAPGMWIFDNNTVFISMPGVPFEMKGLMQKEVLPRLQKQFDRPYILHKTVVTYGKGESTIAAIIEDWENNLPEFIKLAYLPDLGKVRLRLSARGSEKAVLEKALKEQLAVLQTLIGDIIAGYEDDSSLEQVIGALLVAQNKTLAIAESCTGGQIAAGFTKNAGASRFFKGGVVTYATTSKIAVLDVDPTIIKKHSVTSTQVAQAMALGVQQKFNADFAIATTGNAGPTQGDGDVEVGTVFIAIATPATVFSERFEFSNSRERTIGKTVQKALEMLRKEILNS